MGMSIVGYSRADPDLAQVIAAVGVALLVAVAPMTLMGLAPLAIVATAAVVAGVEYALSRRRTGC